MESSQLRRISIVGLSILCLSPIEFFSNKLFDKKPNTTVVLAVNDIKYKENYLSNNYEIFNPNIKATSENLKEVTTETLKTTEYENKGKEDSDSEENNLESENNSEIIEEEIVTSEPVTEVVESVSTEEISTEVPAPAVTNEVSAPIIEAQPTNTDLAANLVNYALQFVGNPYRYGGSDLYNGVDCSGFTMKVYENFGYSLPHMASSQTSYGSYVSIDNLQQGDLIFYGYSGSITHVAIYIGNSQIVHAATSDTGIQVANLYIMPIITARRIINN